MNPSAFSNVKKSRRHIAAWLILSLCMLFAFACAPAKAEDKHAGAAPAAEASGQGAAQAGHGEAHHGLTPEAPTFGDRSKGAWVNSSMIVTWIVALLLIVAAQYATRKIRGSKAAALEPPSGAQNFWEFLVEGLQSFLSEIIGPDLARKTFWFFATVFIFILGVNWFGLLPGVGTIGWGIPKDPSAPHFLEHVTVPLMRGGHADLNMTFALASIFFVLWVFWAVQANGVIGVVKHLFAPKGDTKGALKVMMIAVFLFAGVLEVVSIAFRPVSLSFRLYGNIFAGENLLESMQQLYKPLGFLIPVPFYFMELLVGLVQALVFMLLTAVFTLLICTHDEEHAEHAEGHAHH
jgi:F-type H+-transporting ATPase subunit a